MPGEKTILAVEDSILNVNLLIHTLSDEYKLRIAVDGESALKAVERAVPDLILLDIMLPDIDGFEVCRRLKQNPAVCDVPVIFLTALAEKNEEAIGLSLGAADFIGKPYNPELLKARLRIHLELKAHRDSLDRLVEERTSELKRTQEAVIASMAILSEYRDYETGLHIQRTRSYVEKMAYKARENGLLEMSDYEIDLLGQCAQLHDIGKVGIPDAILLSPKKLTADEFEVIKQHTVIGGKVIEKTADILGENAFIRLAREIALYHHERWDGTGYPSGLSGSDIPIGAQIMSIVDIYDALTSDRPYKKAYTHEQSVKILLEGDGRTVPAHFNPRLLDVFRGIHEEFQTVQKNLGDQFHH